MPALRFVGVGLVLELLRRHVVGGAYVRAGKIYRFVQDFWDAEVSKLDHSVVEEDVGRF